MKSSQGGQKGSIPEARAGRAVREGISWWRPRRRTFGFGSGTFGFGSGNFGGSLGAETFQWFEDRELGRSKCRNPFRSPGVKDQMGRNTARGGEEGVDGVKKGFLFFPIWHCLGTAVI